MRFLSVAALVCSHPLGRFALLFFSVLLLNTVNHSWMLSYCAVSLVYGFFALARLCVVLPVYAFVRGLIDNYGPLRSPDAYSFKEVKDIE